MRTELFAIEKADIFFDKKQLFSQLHMTVYQNEFLGIICSDPEDKSALLSVFNGQASVSSGNLRLDNNRISAREFRKTMPETVTVIGYKNRLIHSLSIAENITLFERRRSGLLINERRNRAEAEKCLQEFDLRLDLDRQTKQLSSRERVMVELLQAYLQGHRAIVLNDPSEFLSRAELVMIHSLLFKLKDKGLAIMVIDNPTSYLLRNMDYLLIIQGRTDLGTFESNMISEKQLKKYLLKGQSTVQHIPDSDISSDYTDDDDDLTEMVMMEDLCTQGLHHIALSLYKGEILKMVCLDNMSRLSFLNLINGEDPITSGDFSLNGKAFTPHNIDQSVRDGVIWLPRVPYLNYLVQNRSAMDNLAAEFSLKSGRKIIYPNHMASLRGFINDFTSITDPDLPIRKLPALSRQELAYAKLILHMPKLVFIEYPFSESTLQMKEATLRMIFNLKKKGICVIILTSSTEMFEEIDGDEMYLKDGRCIDEDEFYEALFEEASK